tara:strand:- start:443 stop:667 length:225 start_codon:yes stop_codon:yes gene_type:complete
MIIDVGHNIDNTPIQQTPFYKWLDDGNATPIGINDINRWLAETFNFVLHQDKIAEQQLAALRWIHAAWNFNRRR